MMLHHQLDLAPPRHLDWPHPSQATAVTVAARICKTILALPPAVKMPVARTRTTQAPKTRVATKTRLTVMMSPAMPTATAVTLTTAAAAEWTMNSGLNVLVKPLVQTPPPLPL